MFLIEVLEVVTIRAIFWVVTSQSLENSMPSGTNGLNLQDRIASEARNK
jgi:hypothetical protein